jgi:hypothetical protein
LLELLVLLLEMIMGTVEEGGHVSELAVEIFPVLPVSDLDMHDETLGHKLNLVAEPFDQHTGVAFDLFDPLVDRIEAGVEPLLLPVKSLIQQGMDALLLPLKPPIEVLREFLVHTASAVGEE